MAQLFARRADNGGAYVVSHPLTQTFVALELGRPYDEDDPLVQAHRWAFVAAGELAEANSAEPVTSVTIETATARPGEKRATRRTK